MRHTTSSTDEHSSGDERLTELARLGVAIYEGDLKAKLEPQYDRQFVAIHVDTRDFAIGRTSATATREILKRHPRDGRLVVMKVGPEPEYGLTARILAANGMGGKSK